MKLVDVTTDILGSLALWNVEDGAAVEEGEPIAEIECMKVFMRVEAPATGIIRCKMVLGEIVGQDDVIAVIEVQE